MRALLDVNVLIALLDSDHSLHGQAMGWFREHGKTGWASCPITQNGCLRIMSHPGYRNAIPLPAVMERLAAASESRYHEFWPDEISMLDRGSVEPARVLGKRQVTDVYLLALSVSRKGRFVTFDRSIAIEAAVGAQNRNLVVL
jgi:toxin-antitoxin system PIN domain toxin